MFLKLVQQENQQILIDYSVLNTEYALLHEDKMILADVNYDKNREATVTQELQRLLHAANPEASMPSFAGGYFIVLIDKVQQKAICYRDAAGIKSGFFSLLRHQSLIIGTQVHAVAKAAGTNSFNPFAVRMLLATEFLYDGFTIYKDVSELTMGSTSVFSLNTMKLERQTTDRINLAVEENTLGWDENVKELRKQIVNVHHNLASKDNIVYLSGGIDSCVMLASLDEVTSKSNIHSISYKVKGTTQDETIYAQSLSKHLGTSLDIIELDPTNLSAYDDFEQKILQMNNPYLGMWIFPPVEANNRETYYGGQDTRLHTPDVSKMDDYIFNCLMNLPETITKSSGWIMQPVHSFYSGLNLYNHANKYARNFDRALNMLDPHQYLLNHFFKFNWRKLQAAFKIHLDKQDITTIAALFHIDFRNIRNKRHLYNVIVSKKWPEQYTDDIRYMQDMAGANQTYMAMPFYDKGLSEWSSSIPYDWSTKFETGKSGFGNETVKINKVLLRAAFRDKLNDEVYYRKKAVSVTAFLLFMGTLGKHIRTVLKNDLHDKESFVRAFGLNDAVQKFLRTESWQLIDQPFLLRIYYIATLCIYHKHIKH